MKMFLSGRHLVSGFISIALSVIFVASVVFASTTISTDINTGGTLTVTGASTLTGNVAAAGTLTVTGLSIFNGQLQASSTALFGGAVTSYGTFNVNGLATTTASTGNIGTTGKIGAGTTTPTTLELSAEGAATTTIAAFSTGALKGGCIQLKGANAAGTLYRIYATTTGPAIIEEGSCK